MSKAASPERSQSGRASSPGSLGPGPRAPQKHQSDGLLTLASCCFYFCLSAPGGCKHQLSHCSPGGLCSLPTAPGRLHCLPQDMGVWALGPLLGLAWPPLPPSGPRKTGARTGLTR